ncbi:hypothetical protein [Mammaliicoccus sp. E-M24]|uniref:hypothetical protein n=1 Tax=Mammaliicoccus sp. E-M24 TaxID=2898684 RepID=UPI001EFAAFF1|nr:hypothetical protein [Mammaliicoccus sp. E-M24]
MNKETYITNIYKHDSTIEITTLESTDNYLYEIPKAYHKDVEYLITLIENQSLDTVFSNTLEDWNDTETLTLNEVKEQLNYYCK